MSSWLKAIKTVLGIVLGSFYVAALGTLLDGTFSVRKQVLPNADSSQKLSLSAQTIINSHTIWSGPR